MSETETNRILIIRSGRHTGRVFTLPDEDVVVGREKSCRIRLGSSDVSRRHCVIRLTEQGVVVRDLGSRNGTQVNDVTIEGEVVLNPGDMLRVGPLVLEYPIPDKANEDEIADWLSAEDDTTGPSDTTIIPGRPREEPESEPVPPPSKPVFDSVAEEAADIIRRHQEMQQGGS